MVTGNDGKYLTLTLSWEMLELLLLTFWTMRFVSAALCEEQISVSYA
jgi:hypothetical protein